MAPAQIAVLLDVDGLSTVLLSFVGAGYEFAVNLEASCIVYLTRHSTRGENSGVVLFDNLSSLRHVTYRWTLVNALIGRHVFTRIGDYFAIRENIDQTLHRRVKKRASVHPNNWYTINRDKQDRATSRQLPVTTSSMPRTTNTDNPQEQYVCNAERILTGAIAKAERLYGIIR